MLFNSILLTSYHMNEKDECDAGCDVDERGMLPVMMYVAGVIAFGFLDGITAAVMMSKYGIHAEFNPLMQFVFATQGHIGFVVFKVLSAAALLLIPLHMHHDMRWTSVLFMFAFVIGGSLAALNNAFFIAECRLMMHSAVIIGVFMMCVVCAMEIGSMMDNSPRFRISDEMWEQMKAEMGI